MTMASDAVPATGTRFLITGEGLALTPPTSGSGEFCVLLGCAFVKWVREGVRRG